MTIMTESGIIKILKKVGFKKTLCTMPEGTYVKYIDNIALVLEELMLDNPKNTKNISNIKLNFNICVSKASHGSNEVYYEDDSFGTFIVDDYGTDEILLEKKLKRICIFVEEIKRNICNNKYIAKELNNPVGRSEYYDNFFNGNLLNKKVHHDFSDSTTIHDKMNTLLWASKTETNVDNEAIYCTLGPWRNCIKKNFMKKLI